MESTPRAIHLALSDLSCKKEGTENVDYLCVY